MQIEVNAAADIQTLQDRLGILHDSFIKTLTIVSHDEYRLEEHVDKSVRVVDDTDISYVQSGRRDIVIDFAYYAYQSEETVLNRHVVATFHNVVDVFLGLNLPDGWYLDGCIQGVHIKEMSAHQCTHEVRSRFVLVIERAICCGEWIRSCIPMFQFERAVFEAK